MEFIKMNTTRIVNGKEVPIHSERQAYATPVDVYRVTLTLVRLNASIDTSLSRNLDTNQTC